GEEWISAEKRKITGLSRYREILRLVSKGEHWTMQSQQRLTPQSGRPRKLYSYVLDHDEGRAPHVSGGLCTLAKCKDRSPGSNRGNIVENARVGDWIIGTGGLGKRSAGHGKLIYAMRVTKRLTLADYRQKYPNR